MFNTNLDNFTGEQSVYRLYHGDTEVAVVHGSRGLTDDKVIRQALEQFDNLSEEQLRDMGITDLSGVIEYKAKIRWAEIRS